MKERPNIAPLSQDDPRLTEIAASLAALRYQDEETAAMLYHAGAALASLPDALEAALRPYRGGRS